MGMKRAQKGENKGKKGQTMLQKTSCRDEHQNFSKFSARETPLQILEPEKGTPPQKSEKLSIIS